MKGRSPTLRQLWKVRLKTFLGMELCLVNMTKLKSTLKSRYNERCRTITLVKKNHTLQIGCSNIFGTGPWFYSETRYNEPINKEVLGITNDFFTSVILKRSRYSEQILPLPWPFAMSRFHCTPPLQICIMYVNKVLLLVLLLSLLL